jgi:putative transposase
MSTMRAYSRDFRESAVGLVLTEGIPIREAADDLGIQYACHECRDLLAEHGMLQSMSRAGDCYDNAMMESLWASLKKELVHDRRFRTHEEARAAGFEWIEVWYQRTRLHSSLGYVSPETFEAAARAG